jgi:hypothetical protein
MMYAEEHKDVSTKNCKPDRVSQSGFRNAEEKKCIIILLQTALSLRQSAFADSLQFCAFIQTGENS